MFRSILTVSALALALVNPNLGAGKVFAAEPAVRPVKKVAKPFDTDKSPEERARVKGNGKDFPRLGDDFEVLSGSSKSFNCIAWSCGNTQEWIWPAQPGAPGSLAAFDSLYGKLGYRRATGLDFRRQPGVDKLVLYGRVQNGQMACTHAARQSADGTWTSKLGKLPLIRHRTPDALSGPEYGQPVAVYVRARKAAV